MPRGASKGENRGAGRPKGSINKDRAEIIAKAKAIGRDPLEVMLMVTNKLLDDGEYEKAGEMASKAAPYINRKMPQAIETKDTTNETWEQLLERIEREKARVGKSPDK